MNTAARFISVVTHPLLMATYLFALLSRLLPAALSPFVPALHSTLVLLILLTTFILPSLVLSVFKFFGMVSDLTMPDRKERILPFTFISGMYMVTTWLFYSRFNAAANDNVMKFMIIIDALVIAATIITMFYKVSIHALAVCGILGILIPLNKVAEQDQLFLPTLGLTVIAGLVMSSRLHLRAHKPREVLVGALTGLLIGFGGVMILLF